MSNRTFDVTAADEGGRLDHFLSRQITDISRSQLQKLITNQGMQSNHLLKIGEVISIDLPEPNRRLQPSLKNLSILFEDEGILVINKPANLVVHPNHFEETDSVVQRLLSYYPAIAEALYDPQSSVSQLRPGIVHRLDKNTSGALVVAKTANILQALAAQFHDHTVQKTYTALLVGRLKEEQKVDANLIRKSGRANRMGISQDNLHGRTAITHFRPERFFQLAERLVVSQVECVIETGRTHQIRAHAKSLGLPLLGDDRYTNRPATVLAKRFAVSRQMLHAQKLQFINPSTDRPLEIICPLAEDIQVVIAALTKASST